jgi:HD-GYP domain-containing protein (c-di-GMP phosphodiesterase class II)
MVKSSAPEYRISVDQLRPGVFIRLIKTHWFDHPFLFSSFKIKDADQIALIRKLGIEEVVCVPEKCDVLPFKPAEKASVPASGPERESTLSQETIDHLWEVKKERARRLKAKKERIAQCEEQFNSCIKSFNNILAGVLGGKLHSVEEAVAFVDRLSAYFLDDRESTLHLMNVVDQAESAYSHPMNVAVLSLMVGREAGLSHEEMTALGLGALFHDVGKAHLPKKLQRRRERG